jgi:hypothetical protein
VIYGLLFQIAAETLQTIAADPKHLGARIGLTLGLHTWGSALTHHPHVHGIVPGGGLSPTGNAGSPANPASFCRGGCSRGCAASPKAVLAYLSRYNHRIAISNQRLVAMGEHAVTFTWKDYGAKGRTKYKTMTLAADEFMRRFLLHVLPTGFHRATTAGSPMRGVRAIWQRHVSC